MINLTEAILGPLLRHNPMGPRITYYDDSTGERIELSTVTLANWAAKTANLLRDECGGTNTSRVAVLLPPHWQTVGVLLGAWWVGAEVILPQHSSHPTPTKPQALACDIALCSADRLTEADTAITDDNGHLSGEVIALSLDPFGQSIADLPVGVLDYATAVRAHGDQFSAELTPGPALAGLTPQQVLDQAEKYANTKGLTSSDRIMSHACWSTPAEIIHNMVAVFAVGASLVQLANPNPELLARRRVTEKITRDL